MQEALRMTDGLFRDGRAAVVVFDRLHPLLSRDDLVSLDRALRQWLPILNFSQGTLIFQTETILPDVYPSDISLPFFASVRLGFSQEEWTHQHHRVSGLSSCVTVIKNKLAPASESVRIRATFNGKVQSESGAPRQ
jgi:hypothetical protein